MTEPLLPPVVQQPLSSQASSNTEHDASANASLGESSEGISSNRPLIFGILFGVTGALGLPLLWYSPVFTRKEKCVWSIINILYTLGLLAIAIASLRVIFDALQQLN